MSLQYQDIKNFEKCKYYDEDNEDSWCKHKDNKRHDLYSSCNSKLCPIIKSS